MGNLSSISAEVVFTGLKISTGENPLGGRGKVDPNSFFSVLQEDTVHSLSNQLKTIVNLKNKYETSESNEKSLENIDSYFNNEIISNLWLKIAEFYEAGIFFPSQGSEDIGIRCKADTTAENIPYFYLYTKDHSFKAESHIKILKNSAIPMLHLNANDKNGSILMELIDFLKDQTSELNNSQISIALIELEEKTNQQLIEANTYISPALK